MSHPGRLIAFEGIDGCGKTTQARLLADSLGALFTFEPGATPLGASLRALLLGEGLVSLSAQAEALLVTADRAQHVSEVIVPALAGGQIVVSDRYSASTLAYQGYGRGLDVADLQGLLQWATGGLQADLNVLLDVDPAVALARIGRAFGVEGGGGNSSGSRVSGDRFESSDAGFFDRVRKGYREMANAERDRWVVFSGQRSVDELAAEISSTVRARFGLQDAC